MCNGVLTEYAWLELNLNLAQGIGVIQPKESELFLLWTNFLASDLPLSSLWYIKLNIVPLNWWTRKLCKPDPADGWESLRRRSPDRFQWLRQLPRNRQRGHSQKQIVSTISWFENSYERKMCIPETEHPTFGSTESDTIYDHGQKHQVVHRCPLETSVATKR